MTNLVLTLETSPQTAVSRVSSRGSQAATSACLAWRACLSQVLIITRPVELFSRWSLSASGGPAAFRPTDSAVKQSHNSTRHRLQLIQLSSGARAQLGTWSHSSGCGGCKVMPCGVAQRVLWVLVLWQLTLWWRLPVWEVWGRGEIEPGRTTRRKKKRCQSHYYINTVYWLHFVTVSIYLGRTCQKIKMWLYNYHLRKSMSFKDSQKIINFNRLSESLFSSPDIPNSLWVWWQRVHGESRGIQGTRQQLQCLRIWAAMSHSRIGARRDTYTSWVDMALVQDDKTGQQQGLMVMVMQTLSYTSGLQDTTLPPVMEHQG